MRAQSDAYLAAHPEQTGPYRAPIPEPPVPPVPVGSPEVAGEPRTAEKGLTDASNLSPPERPHVEPIS